MALINRIDFSKYYSEHRMDREFLFNAKNLYNSFRNLWLYYGDILAGHVMFKLSFRRNS